MKKKKNFSVYLLIVLIGFQSISAMFGGISFISSPNGENLQMPLSYLQGSPFSSYFIPGLILFLLLGTFPVFIFIGLITSKNWSLLQYLNIY